jgi:hypothetical protein
MFKFNKTIYVLTLFMLVSSAFSEELEDSSSQTFRCSSPQKVFDLENEGEIERDIPQIYGRTLVYRARVKTLGGGSVVQVRALDLGENLILDQKDYLNTEKVLYEINSKVGEVGSISFKGPYIAFQVYRDDPYYDFKLILYDMGNNLKIDQTDPGKSTLDTFTPTDTILDGPYVNYSFFRPKANYLTWLKGSLVGLELRFCSLADNGCATGKIQQINLSTPQKTLSRPLVYPLGGSPAILFGREDRSENNFLTKVDLTAHNLLFKTTGATIESSTEEKISLEDLSDVFFITQNKRSNPKSYQLFNELVLNVMAPPQKIIRKVSLSMLATRDESDSNARISPIPMHRSSDRLIVWERYNSQTGAGKLMVSSVAGALLEFPGLSFQTPLANPSVFGSTIVADGGKSRYSNGRGNTHNYNSELYYTHCE